MGCFRGFFELSHVEIAPSQIEEGLTKYGIFGKILDHSFELREGLGIVLLLKVDLTQAEPNLGKEL